MSHFSKKNSTVPSSFSSASMQISGKGGGLLLRLVALEMANSTFNSVASKAH